MHDRIDEVYVLRAKRVMDFHLTKQHQVHTALEPR